MPINAGLINALSRPVRSVQDYQDDYTRQDIQQQGLQRNALLLQEGQALQQDRERTRMDGDTLRNALSMLPAGATHEQRISAMEGTNLPIGYTQADALRKSISEQRKGMATAAKDEADTATKQYTLTREKLKHGIQGLQVAQSPQQAVGMFVDGVRMGYWDENSAKQQIQSMPQDPAQFMQWRQQQLAQILEAEKQLPTIQTRNTGGSTDTLAIDPLTGIPRVTGSVRNTQSPESVASERTAAAGRAQSAQQFGARLAFDREKETTARTDGTKVIPAQQKVADATEVLSLLDTAESLLPGATSSYLGTGIDEAARVVGVGTSGAQSGARLKALEGALISKMPKMSGPQSDKDVLLYKQMAGQIGDSTMPASTRKAAIETIREMNRRYAGMPAESTPAAPAAGYSDAEKERRYQEFKRSQGR